MCSLKCFLFMPARSLAAKDAATTQKLMHCNFLGRAFSAALPPCDPGSRARRCGRKTASGYYQVARRRFRILCCMLSYLEGINRTARRVPVAFDNAVATICPLSLIATAELRWYVSADAPISLLRSVITPLDQTNATCLTGLVPGWIAGSMFAFIDGR